MMRLLALALLAAADAYPLAVKVGNSVAICKTGTIQCPATAPICDDTSIATAVETDEGIAFKGLKPGTTLCSAASAAGAGFRQVYRVVVKG